MKWKHVVTIDFRKIDSGVRRWIKQALRVPVGRI